MLGSALSSERRRRCRPAVDLIETPAQFAPVAPGPASGRRKSLARRGRDKRARSEKRLDPGLRAAEDQRVDVVRALVGVHGFQMAHHAHHVEFVRDAVAAVHVARRAQFPRQLLKGLKTDTGYQSRKDYSRLAVHAKSPLMTRIYGERWKQVRHLKSGGQGDVFAVVDLRGQYAGEYALKRVRNPRRHARFRAEIQAIKRLDHPNVVKLVDHSALDAADSDAGKHFFVMPIAQGGDLNDRAAIYKTSLDSVLQVARQIALALAEAHKAGIVHRDIKPANVLFSGVGHDVLVSDFGICLLRDEIRSTESDEIVGPRSFMAPELETGGRLDVTPAADVYSLGKVIYFMISGGTILPRERLYEAEYKNVFPNGERYTLLSILLGRMVCPVESRHNDMAVVISELRRIEEWEVNAHLTPFTPTAYLALDRIKQRAIIDQRIAVEHQFARRRRAERLGAMRSSFFDWLMTQLEAASALIRASDIVEAKVGEAQDSEYGKQGRFPHWGTIVNGSNVRPLSGRQISIQWKGDDSKRVHTLQFFLCEKTKPDTNEQLFLVPYYQFEYHTDVRPNSYRRQFEHGFLNRSEEHTF